MLLTVLTLLGAVCLFIFSMNMLSNALQKAFSPSLRSMYPWMTSSVPRRIMAGAAFTTAVMSSGATTLMAVTSVNNSLLTLPQAAGVILGANLGSTVIPWVITLFGFSIKLGAICYIVFFAGYICTKIKRLPGLKLIGNIMMALSIMFLALNFIGSSLTAINDSYALTSFLESIAGHGFGSVLLFVLLGIVISIIFLSSSATIIFSLVLLSFGWIPYPMACAMAIGANVGTTVNTLVASNRGNVMAKRAGFIRTMTNSVIAVLALILFHPLVNLTGWFISLFGAPNPTTLAFIPGTPLPVSALYGVCTFNTLFYLIPTIVLAFLCDKIAALSEKIIPGEPPVQDSNIKYISSGLLRTPAISVLQAFNEVVNFGEIAYEGFQHCAGMLNAKDDDTFEAERAKLVEYEQITDKMEYSIAQFLSSINSSELNESESVEIKTLYRIIGELESLGDSGENFSRILEREKVHNQEFSEETKAQIMQMLRKVDSAFCVMNFNLKSALSSNLDNIENAEIAEDDINSARNRMREEAIATIERHGDSNYQSMNYFLDIIENLETMGDFIINVSQAVMKAATEIKKKR